MTADSRGLDAYSTPPALAEMLVAAVRGRRIDVVVDPAAGDGALLMAAARRWPAARLIGADVDPAQWVRADGQRRWSVQTKDLLNPADRAALLRTIGGDTRRCVLLNPPFSFRGGRFWQVEVDGGPLRVSRAMAFFLSSLELVGVRGELVAVVPAGLLHGERDAHARQYLSRVGELVELRRNPSRSFRGAVTATALVRWVPSAPRRSPVLGSPPTATLRGAPVTVVRGTCQMHTVDGRKAPADVELVHTTALQDNQLRRPLPRVGRGHRDRVVAGPAVLLPRVGLPDGRKLVVVTDGELLLSDCVYGLCCASLARAEDLADDLGRGFETELARVYGGTGAPYLILVRLVDFLRRLGYDARALS